MHSLIFIVLGLVSIPSTNYADTLDQTQLISEESLGQLFGEEGRGQRPTLSDINLEAIWIGYPHVVRGGYSRDYNSLVLAFSGNATHNEIDSLRFEVQLANDIRSRDELLDVYRRGINSPGSSRFYYQGNRIVRSISNGVTEEMVTTTLSNGERVLVVKQSNSSNLIYMIFYQKFYEDELR